MLMMMLLAITASTRTIDIASAYFVPDEVALKSLCSAVHRGVRVRVITPGPHTDEDTVRHASRGLWGPLLEAGVEIYEFQPTMFHCKMLIVDGLMASLGSTNFDPRSFHLNDEANLNVYDTAFAQRMTQVFEADLAQSRRITYEAWRGRPLSIRLQEQALAMFGSLL